MPVMRDQWRRFQIRFRRCPYCGRRFDRLVAHLEWAHASRRSEWEGVNQCP